MSTIRKQTPAHSQLSSFRSTESAGAEAPETKGKSSIWLRSRIMIVQGGTALFQYTIDVAIGR